MSARDATPAASRPAVRFLALAAWLAVIIATVLGSLLPDTGFARTSNEADLTHLAVYALLAALPTALKPRWRTALAVVIVVSTCGAVIEVLQALFTQRQGTLDDALVNVAGATAGAVLAMAGACAVRRLWGARNGESVESGQRR